MKRSKAALHSNSRLKVSTSIRLAYEKLEPRQLLAGDVMLGSLNQGIAVSDTASGAGFLMYSEEAVQSRFAGVTPDNSEHLIAVRNFNGTQWQFNNDVNWVNFSPEPTDLLIADVNFDNDSVATLEGATGSFGGIARGFTNGDLWFVGDSFNGVNDDGEFQVLGSGFDLNEISEFSNPTEVQLEELADAVIQFEELHGHYPNVALFDDDGSPLLSWRVQLLPFLGHQELYQQFNLDEPWDSTNNIALLDQMPDVFKNAAVTEPGKTNYLAVVGEGTMFPETSEDFSAEDLANADGADNTILFVEAYRELAEEWTRPRDLVFNETNPGFGFQSLLIGPYEIPQTSSVVFADGTAFTTSQFVQESILGPMLLRDDGQLNLSKFQFENFIEKTSFETNLSELVEASHRFEEANGEFPAHAIYSDAGEPLLSWRVAILPYIGQQSLYDQFRLDERWDSEHNISLIRQMPSHFITPEGFLDRTNILAVTGEDSFFRVASEGRTRAELLADGFENTLMFVEGEVDRDTELVFWTQPGDLEFDADNPRQGLGDTFIGAFGDGTVESLDEGLSDSNLIAMAEIGDEEIVDFSNIAPFRSAEQNLETLGEALLNFSPNQLPSHAIYSDSGVPLLSWRVGILPKIGQQNLFDRFNLDEPWDSENNLALIPLMPRIYATEGVGNGLTVFVASNGQNTAFPIGENGVSFDSITDGLSETILLVQANSDQAVQWTRPVDLEFDEASPADGLGMATESGFPVVVGDGEVRFVNNLVSAEDIGNLLQINDGEIISAQLEPAVRFAQQNEVVQRQLGELARAALDFELDNNRLPAHAIYSNDGTTPLLSWRVAVLPYLGYQSLYDQFNLDEAWDSPTNLALVSSMPEVYAHPQLDGSVTVMLAVTGEETAFPISVDGREISEFTDGTSNTLLFVEANSDRAVTWTRPDDLLFDASDPSDGIGEIFAGGNNFALADGSTHFLDDCVDPEVLTELFSVADGGTADWQASCNLGSLVRTLVATEGDDDISVTVTDDVFTVTINDDVQEIDRNMFQRVAIDGLAGDNTVVVFDQTGFGVGVIRRGEVSVTSDFGLSIQQSGDITLEVAEVDFLRPALTVFGTNSDETFFVTEESVAVRGIDYNHRATGFGEISLYGTQDASTSNGDGGVDSIFYFDSEGDDTFSENGFNYGFVFVRNRNFDHTTALSRAGGNDTANFRLDSVDTDRLVAGDGFARLFGDGTSTRAEGFEVVNIEGARQQDRLLGVPVTLVGSSGDDQIRLSPFNALYDSPSTSIVLTNVSDITAVGNGEGQDQISLLGTTTTDDVFLFDDGFSQMEGGLVSNSSQFLMKAIGFNSVVANGLGGSDKVTIFDSIRTDEFFANTELFSMKSGVGIPKQAEVFAINFESALGLSRDGGGDRAELIGTAGNESFFASPNSARLQYEKLDVRVSGFNNVEAHSKGGDDVAVFGDSIFDDIFHSNSTSSFMTGAGFTNRAVGFATNIATSTSGNDGATITGTSGVDQARFSKDLTTWFSTGRRVRALAFPSVTAMGGDGDDIAKFIDSSDDDTFFADRLNSGMNGEGYSISARSFEFITAFTQHGGNDVAIIEDSSGDDVFNANSLAAVMRDVGNTYSITAVGFDSYIASSIFGGNDFAALTDSDEDDELTLSGDIAEMTGFGYRLLVREFEIVNANGFNGGVNSFDLSNDVSFTFNLNGAWVERN